MPKEKFKIIPTVYLLLLKNNKILLSRRYNTGFHDGEYSLPAGHLDGNETLIQALIRESEEEIGIKVDKDSIDLNHIMHRKESSEERINFFFTAKNWQGEPKIMEPHKCDDLNWASSDNLPHNTIPYVKQAINYCLNKIIYSEYGF